MKKENVLLDMAIPDELKDWLLSFKIHNAAFIVISSNDNATGINRAIRGNYEQILKMFITICNDNEDVKTMFLAVAEYFKTH